jgi:hypothetical protein
VRQITNRDRWNSPASVLGIEVRRLELHEVLLKRQFGPWCKKPCYGRFVSQT